MTEAKFTPGPWTYSTHSDGWSYTIHIAQADDAAYTPDWSDVAYTTCRGERQKIQEANARLIAAAPELLAACQKFMYSVPHTEIRGETGSLLEVVREAITKATGEQA